MMFKWGIRTLVKKEAQTRHLDQNKTFLEKKKLQKSNSKKGLLKKEAKQI